MWHAMTVAPCPRRPNRAPRSRAPPIGPRPRPAGSVVHRIMERVVVADRSGTHSQNCKANRDFVLVSVHTWFKFGLIPAPADSAAAHAPRPLLGPALDSPWRREAASSDPSCASFKSTLDRAGGSRITHRNGDDERLPIFGAGAWSNRLFACGSH